jgi:hypothetical protein
MQAVSVTRFGSELDFDNPQLAATIPQTKWDDQTKLL